MPAHKCTREDNIKRDITEIGCENVDQDSVQTRVIRSRATDLRDTQIYVAKFGYLSYVN